MTIENASAQAEGLAQPADTTQQTVTGAESQEQQHEERRFTQAELEEKVQKRVAREARKADARYQELQREIEALKAPKPAETKSESEPKRADFDSYEAFVEARAEWRADQKVTKRLEEFEGKGKKDAEKAKQEESKKAFDKRVETVIDNGNKNFPDFDAVINEAVEDGVIPIDSPMYYGIMDSDIGDKIAYHLAKKPAEAKRILALGPYGQAREIGKLEDKLSAKKEPRETMEPINGRNSSTNGLRDDLSMDAWVKARNKQIKDSRG